MKQNSMVPTLNNQNPYAQERMALIKKAKKKELTYTERERLQVHVNTNLIDYLLSFKPTSHQD